MSVHPVPARLHKNGGSMCISLPLALREQLPWRIGDLVAIRLAGEKLIIERIPMEKFSVLRTGEAQPNDGNLCSK